MPNLIKFKPFFVVIFLVWSTLARTLPTVNEFETEVLKILDTYPDYQEDYTTYEKNISWLVKTGNPRNTLYERAYRRSLELIKTDRWQEAIWTLKRSGLVPYGNALESFLGLAMENLDFKGSYLSGEGINRSSLATIQLSERRSIQVLTKSGDGSTPLATEAEIGTHRIDDFFNINMVALTMSGKHRGSQEMSMQLVVPGMIYSGLNFRDRGYQYAYPEVYFLDFLMGNLDRHHENSGYTRAKRFFFYDHGRLLAYGSFLAPLEIHKQPFDKNYQLPYFVEQKIRHTSVAQFASYLKSMEFPQTAIDYMSVTYASAKQAIESRPTLAPPIAIMTASSSFGPNQESPLMVYMRKKVDTLIKRKREEAEAMRLKAQAQEDALDRFFAEQEREMEALFMETTDSMYESKVNRAKNFEDLKYIISLDRVTTTAVRQTQLLEKIVLSLKEGKITRAEFLDLHARFVKLRLAKDVRTTAESILKNLSAESTQNRCRRFYGN